MATAKVEPLDMKLEVVVLGVPTSEELPAMRTTEAIDEYDLVAFRDNVEHLASRVGDSGPTSPAA